MKSKISICFLTIVVILLALVMIEKINTQRAADKAAIIAQRNENDKEEKNEKESLLTSNEAKNAKYCIKNDSGMLAVYNATASEKYFDTGVYFEELPDEAKIRLQTDSTFLTKLICTIFLKAIQVNVKINQLGERICTM